jgi:hypothetical protein
MINTRILYLQLRHGKYMLEAIHHPSKNHTRIALGGHPFAT